MFFEAFVVVVWDFSWNWRHFGQGSLQQLTTFWYICGWLRGIEFEPETVQFGVKKNRDLPQIYFMTLTVVFFENLLGHKIWDAKWVFDSTMAAILIFLECPELLGVKVPKCLNNSQRRRHPHRSSCHHFSLFFCLYLVPWRCFFWLVFLLKSLFWSKQDTDTIRHFLFCMVCVFFRLGAVSSRAIRLRHKNPTYGMGPGFWNWYLSVVW